MITPLLRPLVKSPVEGAATFVLVSPSPEPVEVTGRYRTASSRDHEPLARTVVILVVLTSVVSLATACSSGGDDDASPAGGGGAAPGLPGGFGQGPAGGRCQEVPSEPAAIAWLPGDLPLPDGSFAVEELPEQSGLRRAILAVPVTYDEFARYALGAWPDRGWILGRGESELGEAETSFIKGATYGAFRARNVYCGGDWSELLLALGSTDATTTTGGG